MSAPQSSTTPTNPPDATASTDYPPSIAHSDFSASTIQTIPPSMHRRPHALAFFSVSVARALRRALPGVRHSEPNTNLSTDLFEQNVSQSLLSFHGLANAEVPVMTDNQVCLASVFPRPAKYQVLIHCFYYQPLRLMIRIVWHRMRTSIDLRIAFWLTCKVTFMYVLTTLPISCFLQPLPQSSTSRTPEHRHRHTIAPSSRSGARPLLGRISERFHGSHPNTNESTELQDVPAPDHEPAIVEVPLAHDKQVCFPTVL